jgi:DNA-binding response OmpR family regulator
LPRPSKIRATSWALVTPSGRVFVCQLRKKLGDDAADPRLIVTHFGLGYRWIAGAGDAGVPS